MHPYKAEAAALVEPQRINVVVSGNDPQAGPPPPPGQLPGRLDQRGARHAPLLARDVLGLAIYREFGPPDDPGVVFFLGPGLLEVSGHTVGPAGRSVMTWIQVRDVYAEHARLAAAGVPIVRAPQRSPGA